MVAGGFPANTHGQEQKRVGCRPSTIATQEAETAKTKNIYTVCIGSKTRHTTCGVVGLVRVPSPRLKGEKGGRLVSYIEGRTG